MVSKRNFFGVCAAWCLLLLLLSGCGTKTKTPVTGQNEPNPVKAQGLPEAGEWTVPFLQVYVVNADEDNRTQLWYACEWDLQKGCMTRGELYDTKPHSLLELPDEWQPQCRNQYDGTFSYTRNGEKLREELPESDADMRRVTLEGDTVVAIYYQPMTTDNELTGVEISVARYSLGQSDQATWTRMEVQGYENAVRILSENPVYINKTVYIAAGESVLAFNPETEEVTEPLDIAQLNALFPEATPYSPEWGYEGIMIVGCYDDILIINRILYAGDVYHSINAVYKDGVLAGAAEYRSDDEEKKYLYDGNLKLVGTFDYLKENGMSIFMDQFPMQF